MNHRFALFLLSFGFFVVATEQAWACKKDDIQQAGNVQPITKDASCCAQAELQTDCCSEIKVKHSDSDCPCDHENGSCQCPGCHIIGYTGTALTLETPLALLHVLNFSVRKQAFYFAEHIPEAVYLPIWQPPKLGA